MFACRCACVDDGDDCQIVELSKHSEVCVCACVCVCVRVYVWLHVDMCVCVCVCVCVQVFRYMFRNKFHTVFRYMFSNKFWSATVLIPRLMSQGLLYTHDIFCVLDLLHFQPMRDAS